MKRTLELRLKTAEINLNYWMPTDQDALTFPFQEGKLKGVISLNLDPEAVDYDYVEDAAGQWHKVPLSCGQVVVRIVGECDDEVTDKEFLRIAQALTAKYLNNMLLYIRTELGQYWVSLIRISEWDLNYFLLQANAKWIDEPGETEVLQGLDKAFATPPISEFYYRSLGLDKTRWESIPCYIQERPDRDLTKTLMVNAKQYFEDGDYRMAAVEAATALEVGLSPFIRERCKMRGVSYTKFDKTRNRLFISDCLRVLLPLVLGEQELDAWLRINSPGDGLTGQFIIDRCLQLNSVRNDVVHEGKIPKEKVDIERIKRGIEASELLLHFIRDVSVGSSTDGMS